jgi:hypothetical protein
MITCGLKHVAQCHHIIQISKEEHCASSWLSVVNWLSATHRMNNIKFTYNLRVPVVYIPVHPLLSTGSVNSRTTFSLALLSLPSNRSSPVQILQFTQQPKQDSLTYRT